MVIDDGDTQPADGWIAYADWLSAAARRRSRRDATGGEYVQLIYSSGTTGRPKGVLVSAEQQEWSVDAFGSCFDVDRYSRQPGARSRTTTWPAAAGR